MKHLLEFGAPPDAPAWSALAAALLLGILAAWPLKSWRTLTWERQPVLWVGILSATAGLLSLGYVSEYLRGGPRIIDATSYWLEARALAHGLLSFGVPEPLASFRGRFLVTAEEARRLAVIFPPGYPAILAIGFIAGVPLLVGPAIAAALVVATYVLALRAFDRTDIAALAGMFSTVCAALRYHTADTMSHGWAALLLCVTLGAALKPRGTGALVAGLACGGLLATRPVTGVMALGLGTWLIAARSGQRDLIRFVMGLLPGIGLLGAHQYLATGSWWTSSQARYYALADGPPGCFAYGLGSEIGCRFEHGDFVRAELAKGYGPLEALRTTGRRLITHLEDIANVEVLALLVPVAAVRAWQTSHPGRRALALATGGIVIVYAPFYFDGNYPGGGARMFADVLPLEHVLLASILGPMRWGRLAVPVALLGFSVHAVFGHIRLAERDGGRPMWEPEALEQREIRRGLVFVDTDHGFNLGFDPVHFDASSAVVVARRRADANDWILWDLLGRPKAFRYVYDPTAASAVPSVTEYVPSRTDSLIFEAESQWPALSVDGGWLRPDFHPAASLGKGLRLTPLAGQWLRMTLEVVVPRAGRYRVVSHWVLQENSVYAEIDLGGVRSARRLAGPPGVSVVWPGNIVDPAPGPHKVTVAVSSFEVLLDRVSLVPLRPLQKSVDN